MPVVEARHDTDSEIDGLDFKDLENWIQAILVSVSVYFYIFLNLIFNEK